MLALIDADIILHRAGYASDGDSQEIALLRADSMIRDCLQEVGADSYELWLSDNRENNFRYQIDPEYKANRKQPRPIHYDAIKEFMFDEWKANLALGQEADDSLGIQQTKVNASEVVDSVICSIDKDLLQIPGEHYNFVRKEFQTVEFLDGIRHFYKQMLIGDVSDNIRGIDKIGPVKAAKLLDQVYDDFTMCTIVSNLYNDPNRFIKNAQLLWIRREEDEIWNPPTQKEVSIEQEQEARLLSIQTWQKEVDLLSGLTTPATSGSHQVGYSMVDSTKSTELQ